MKIHYIHIFALCLATSCDKVKNLARDATSKVKQGIVDGSDATPDPELLKLVDQTDEGVIFRKDLPFPKHVQVKVSTTEKVNLRTFENSEIERKSGTLNNMTETTADIELSGDHLRYTPGILRATDPSIKDADGKVKAEERPEGTEPVRNFERRGGKWHAPKGGDFLVAAKSSEIAPFMEVLLQEHALAPRPQWFAKRRVKIGEEIALTGDVLPMLISGKAKGTLKLKLESIGEVAGHPCGVFSVTGSYSQKQFPAFLGGFTDSDVTIESGKVWLSLLHPLVLKWERDAVISNKSGGNGGQQTQMQGTSSMTNTLEWKPMERGL